MKQQRFEEIKDMILKNFKDVEQGEFELDDMPGEGEYLEFDGPIGKMRLEGINKPAIEKTDIIATKTAGQQATEKRTYSETDKVFVFKAYKWDEFENDWLKIDMEDFEV